MKSGLDFLIAAKRCEIDELEQLALMGDLVQATSRLVHALQRERGLSNLYLGSGGVHFGPQRLQQIEECMEAQAQLQARFEHLDMDATRPGNGARLFSRIAYVLHGLDGLPQLRCRIERLELQPTRATAAIIKLVAGLLAVVFEAADSATDPEVSRLLVAMFHLMQGKEFAGQERALGAAAFASGHAVPADQQQLAQLVDRQQACLAGFSGFASSELATLWNAAQPAAALARRHGLRALLADRAQPSSRLDRSLSQPWYDCCTRIIDAMRTVEERLAEDLLQLCRDKIVRARADLQAHQALLASMATPAAGVAAAPAAAFFDDDTDPAGRLAPPALAAGAQVFGPLVERSVFELLRDQTQKLQTARDELDSARAALHERKLVERAKGLLMAHRQISEEEAHKAMRQMAMSQNRRLVDVAESVLAMADMLPAGRSR